jgi:hypothetical protein
LVRPITVSLLVIAAFFLSGCGPKDAHTIDIAASHEAAAKNGILAHPPKRAGQKSKPSGPPGPGVRPGMVAPGPVPTKGR